MTNPRLLSHACMVIALASALPALAQETARPASPPSASPTMRLGADQDSGRSRLWDPAASSAYVGFNGGVSTYDLPGCSPGASCDDKDIGYKAYAGAQLSRLLGVEVSYVDLGRLDRNSGDMRAKGVNLGLVVNFPVTEQIGVFGKVGAVYGWTRTGSPITGVRTGNRSDFNLSYGAGAQYDIDSHWAIRADWDAYRMEFAGGRDTVSLYSIGGLYKF